MWRPLTPVSGTTAGAALAGSGDGSTPAVAQVSEEKAGAVSGLQPDVAEDGLEQLDDDAPEMLPDNERTARLEQVVSQIIEENRSLKRRTKPAEWRSHSSWHGRTPGEVAVMSPVSFVVNDGHGIFSPVSPSHDARGLGSRMRHLWA